MTINVFHDVQRVKVNTAWHNLKNHKVLLKDSVGPNEGPWLVMDPVGGSSCVPRVPLYDLYVYNAKIWPI